MTTAIDTTPAARTDDSGPAPAALSRAPGALETTPCRFALHADDPAECIAAIPALLGFAPRRSVVAGLLQHSPGRPGRAQLAAVACHDLDRPGEFAELARNLATICAHENAIGVLVLIVDDRAGTPRGPWASWHRDLVAAIECALTAEQIVLDDAWVVPDIAEGYAWWDVRDPTLCGVQTDPAASALAGNHACCAHPCCERAPQTSSATARTLVAPDERLTSEVGELLEQVEEDAGERFRAAVRHDAMDRYHRETLAAVLDRICAANDAGDADTRGIASTAVALRNKTVRDALFAVAGTEYSEAAERLWSRMCRALTGPDRAEAAALLGYSAYTRGDSSLAAVALQAAAQSDPDHTMARLLDTALTTGMCPRAVRVLACSGRTIAADLGIELDVRPGWLPG
ncbi:DUF4192 domain-containing protein [Nocardia alni]|uniref:DUF4192 domain-containing protein n=1 Tax=Nocardia alni TaxID=2815723 RepID=UPI001C22407B|nr:DUF4192 domain-containing protein [Nocardia alni]